MMVAEIRNRSVIMLKQDGILAFVLLVEQAMLQVIASAVCYLHLASDGDVMLLYKSVETEFLGAIIIIPVRLRLLFLRVQVSYFLEVLYIIYLLFVWIFYDIA